MATKNFNADENRERDKTASEDWKSHHEAGKHFPEEAKGIGEVDVKNAHASGDGSFGRNDSSVPDKEEQEKKKDSSY